MMQSNRILQDDQTTSAERFFYRDHHVYSPQFWRKLYLGPPNLICQILNCFVLKRTILLWHVAISDMF